MIKEKRIYSRLKVYHLAKYRVLSGNQKGEKLVVSIKDIGGGGICLLINEDLPISSVIQVYIQFPGIREPIPCLAKIAWKKYLRNLKRYKVGAQFIEIEDIARKEIIERVKDVNDVISEEDQEKDEKK